mmetsp:Transcript_111294/g.321811  ORF Transcript_111294/g.321811 Transcript_111294/m.321811 type:complete len:227 (-) Transcript_111294:1381-2061(-)
MHISELVEDLVDIAVLDISAVEQLLEGPVAELFKSRLAEFVDLISELLALIEAAPTQHTLGPPRGAAPHPVKSITRVGFLFLRLGSRHARLGHHCGPAGNRAHSSVHHFVRLLFQGGQVIGTNPRQHGLISYHQVVVRRAIELERSTQSEDRLVAQQPLRNDAVTVVPVGVAQRRREQDTDNEVQNGERHDGDEHHERHHHQWVRELCGVLSRELVAVIGCDLGHR